MLSTAVSFAQRAVIAWREGDTARVAEPHLRGIVDPLELVTGQLDPVSDGNWNCLYNQKAAVVPGAVGSELVAN